MWNWERRARRRRGKEYVGKKPKSGGGWPRIRKEGVNILTPWITPIQML